MLRIDCQSHVFPAAYAKLLTHSRQTVQTTGGAGKYSIRYGDNAQFDIRLAEYDPAVKLRMMDAAHIDVSVLSVNIPTPDLLEPELALDAAMLCNEYLAEVCARYPGRFVGLASLPLQDVPSALAQLDYALDTLDLRGVFLPSHIHGMPLDAPELEPFYAHVAARGVPLVLHPTVPTWGAAIKDYSMIAMVGFMVDTSFAMLRLILGGVLERHPQLKVVHPHAGGVLPYVMGRIDEQTEVKRRGRDHISRPPSSYYRQVYFDLASPSAAAMRYMYDFADPDRLLFGSDHPWVDTKSLIDMIETLDLPAEHLTKLMGGNAAQLFRIADR